MKTAALDVAGWADLQRHAVFHQLRPQLRRVIDMVSMADAPGAEAQRVFDRIRPLRIARMAGVRHIQFARKVKYGAEIPQRHDTLGSGKVEANHAHAEILSAQAHRLQILLHIDRLRPDNHGAQQNAVFDLRVIVQRLCAPLQNSFDGVTLRKPLAAVKLRGKPDLVVDMPLPCQHADELARHAHKARPVLQQLQRQFKAF